MRLFTVFTITHLVFATENKCFSEKACRDYGINRVSKTHADSPGKCQEACRDHRFCRYFTHYNSEVASGLANVCLLLSSCSDTTTDCRGCTSGPWRCQDSCSSIDPFGGQWFCPQNKTQPSDRMKCFYTCANRLETSTCLWGTWDSDHAEKRFSCPCSSPPAGEEDLTCSQQPSNANSYPGGTTCR